MSDDSLRMWLTYLAGVFLIACLIELGLAWRDGLVRRRIRRRSGDRAWLVDREAWLYGLTRVVLSGIFSVLLGGLIVTWLQSP